MLSEPAILTLQNLPHDIHVCILVFLDWQSVKALRLSCQIFTSLLPKEQLESQRTLCATLVHWQETELLRLVEAEYWEAAEQAFLGLNYSGFSSSHDPDLAAILKRRTCSSDLLPCYFCLRWLPSSTADNKFATESCFSRTRSTMEFDLGGKRAKSRNCIECGFRKGMYHRGTVVKQSYVCLGCGKMGDPIPGWKPFRALDSHRWWRGSFCQTCFDDPEICNMTAEQLWHERHFGKYDRGLKNGKIYRMQKGQVLREKKGINIKLEIERGQGSQSEQKDCADPATGRDRKGHPPSKDRGPNAGYCHVMDEMRFCYCGGWNPPWVKAQANCYVSDP